MIREIFISYSRDDKALVHPFVKQISKAVEKNCWIDLKGIESGEEFEEVIMKAIDECRIVLFMLSDNSLKSKWTKREVYYAESQQKRIVPVLINGGKLRGWFQFHFGNVDFIDIRSEEQTQKLIHNLRDWLGVEETKETEEEEAKRRTQEEAKRKAEEEARRKAEEEAKRKAEEEAKRKAKEEAKRKAKEEAKHKAEEEAKRKAEEEARHKAEEEAKRKAKEEARKKAEEEAKRKAEEEAKRKAEEEAKQRAEDEYNRIITSTQERITPFKASTYEIPSYTYADDTHPKKCNYLLLFLLSFLPSAYCILCYMNLLFTDSNNIYEDTIMSLIMAFDQKIDLVFPSLYEYTNEILLTIFILSALTISLIQIFSILSFSDLKDLGYRNLVFIPLTFYVMGITFFSTVVSWLIPGIGEWFIELFIPNTTRGFLFMGSHFLFSICFNFMSLVGMTEELKEIVKDKKTSA